nr:hypothetical protein [Tanacetum cinerariifolium]
GVSVGGGQRCEDDSDGGDGVEMVRLACDGRDDGMDVVADIAKDAQDADVQVNADIQDKTAESQAKIYKIDLDHANKVVTAAGTTISAADVPIPAAPKLTATPSRRTKGVVIRDLE